MRETEGKELCLTPPPMRSAFAMAAGRFGAIDELCLFSGHPAHKIFYVRMISQNLWCRVLGSEFDLAEGSV